MFKPPGGSVIFSPNTLFIGGAPSDLANGVEVLVTGSVEPMSRNVMATRIRVRQPAAHLGKFGRRRAQHRLGSWRRHRLRRQVGLPHWRTEGGASESTVVDGAFSDLTNGRAVEGEGVIAGAEAARYVKRSRLRFIT